MKKQNFGVLLGVICFLAFVAGWSWRGIYEDQKPPQTPTLSQAHELGWLQGYSAAVKRENASVPADYRPITLRADFRRDSLIVAKNQFRAIDEKN
jgi:hypothetical protein